MNYDNIYFTYLNGMFITFETQQDLERFLCKNCYSIGVIYVFKYKKFVMEVYDYDYIKVGRITGLSF